ncbi:DUF559 domain-containing protein [Pseudarthrobacter cellobiosi]|uniref:DUF559 domain-containing protein n=1 Tax=Pseudarthrobacter cellobiosi TaxID=2953654 RepID=UPI00208E6A50|nr:DUF559 domain-containing protein [Pseudarthrobacter sp. HLT1-5]MCO4255112.1 endonuclease domain-containing protein [Pseudarthrobacter sp. HLT1-5]
MRKQDFLPQPLAAGPFTFGSALASGDTLNRLRRKDVVNVGRGLYRPADWDFDLEGAARALSAASHGAWISHVTAARLRCQLLPPWLADSTELHLSKPRSLPAVRRKGVSGHTVLALEDEIELIDGIRMSTWSRTWLDLARILPLKDLVSMGDDLIRIPRVDFEGRTQPYDTVAGLRILAARHPNLQGIVRAREALDLMRVGADSAPESLLRLAIADAGLPQPELQVPLRAGDARSPSADLAYRHRRLAIQYDGGHHLGDAQILSDRRRDKAFESAGWTVLVFDQSDLADDFQQSVVKIKKGLRKGWLDHPQAAGFASSD